jgi:hypothetical protein
MGIIPQKLLERSILSSESNCTNRVDRSHVRENNQTCAWEVIRDDRTNGKSSIVSLMVTVLPSRNLSFVVVSSSSTMVVVRSHRRWLQWVSSIKTLTPLGRVNATRSLYGQRNSHIEEGSRLSCVVIGRGALSAWVLGVVAVGVIES